MGTVNSSSVPTSPQVYTNHVGDLGASGAGKASDLTVRSGTFNRVAGRESNEWMFRRKICSSAAMDVRVGISQDDFCRTLYLSVVASADPTHRLQLVNTSNTGEFNCATGSSVVAKGGNGRRYENVSIILRCDSTFLNHLVGDQLCNVIAATPDGVARR